MASQELIDRIKYLNTEQGPAVPEQYTLRKLMHDLPMAAQINYNPNIAGRLDEQVREIKQNNPGKISEIDNKMNAWNTVNTAKKPISPMNPIDAVKAVADYDSGNDIKTVTEMMLKNETPETLQAQRGQLASQQKKPDYQLAIEIANETENEAKRQKRREEYQELPDAVTVPAYLTESFVGGVTDWTSGIYNAMDAISPKTDLNGNPISNPTLEWERKNKENTENLIADTGSAVPDGVRQSGWIPRAIGYSFPSAVLARVPAINQIQAASAAKGAVAGLFGNPLFWASAVPMYGNSYADAKKDGASEEQAQAFAILNGFLGAAVEVSGGIEKIPSSSTGLKRLIKTQWDEGKEEVIQGVIEQFAKKIVYDQEKEWFSLTDTDTVFSGSRALQEFASGVLVGGILGGGQTIVGKMQLNAEYAAIGKQYLQNEETIKEAITIGMTNAPGTDAFAAAQKISTMVEKGNMPSAATMGRMISESYSDSAIKARNIRDAVLDSAEKNGVALQTAEDISAIAVRFERSVEFVSPEQLQVVGENGVSTAEGRYTDGKVQLNAAMPAERLTGYLIKHELTHSIEGTKQWAQLEQIVRSYYGDAAFEEAKTEVMRRYAANNTQLTPEGAAREVVAQWVGENLFRDGFAQAIASGDASVGNAFLQTLDKIRLALGGTKNSRTAGNIALVERLFMRALEGEKNSQNTGEQYAIVALDNGKIYVQADRKILSGTDKEVWKAQIDDFFDKVLLKNGSLTVKSVEGDILTITKDNTVWKGKDEHVLENGLLRFLRKDEYRVKLTALSHIDELAEASRVQRNKDGSRRVEPDTKNHPFAKDGFEYRTVFFQDFDGKYYRIALSVGLADGISTVYSIGVTKETTVPDASIISAIGSKAQGTIVSNTKISQNSFGVNSYDMQNADKNSQYSFSSENDVQNTLDTINSYVDDEAVTVDAKEENSQAIPNLEDTPDADTVVEDISKKVMENRQKKLTQAEQKREAARSDLLDRFENGEISRSEMEAALTRLDREASTETAKKYQTGQRGTAVQKEVTKTANREYRESYQKSKREVEAQKRCTELRNSIQSKLDEVSSKLRRPQKNRYIPQEWVPYVQNILEAVQESPEESDARLRDIESKMQETTDINQYKRLAKKKEKLLERKKAVTENLQNLRSAYAQLESNEEFQGSWQKAIADRLSSTADMLRGRTTKDLSMEELESVLETVNAVTRNISESQKLHCQEYEKDVHETGLMLAQESTNAAAEQGKLFSRNFLKKIVNTQLTPDRLFGRLAGFKKNSAWEKVGKTFVEGQKRQFRTLQKFDNHFQEIIKDQKQFEGLSSTKEKDLVDVGLKDKDGKSIRMTRDFMLSLYNVLSCRANRDAVIYGGIKVPDMELFYKYGMTKEAYDKGSRVTKNESLDELYDLWKQFSSTDDVNVQREIYGRITEIEVLVNQSYDAILENIESMLTNYEKAYCKIARSWFDVVSKNMINEATMEVLGFPRAVVEKYYPIHRDTDFVQTEFSSLVCNMTLENSGYLKTRVKSSAPVLLTGMAAELDLSSRNTAKLVGFLKPESDFRKLMNVHDYENSRSVKTALRGFGSDIGQVGVDAVTYLENLIADLTTGRRFEKGWMSGFQRAAVRSVMTLNPRVAMIQAAAYPTAAAEIGWKYLAKGTKNLHKKAPVDLITKYSAYGYIRNRGEGGMQEFTVAHQGTNVVDNLYNTIDKKTNGWVFGWCQKMDTACCNSLWWACEEKIKDTRPELKVGSEEYYQAVGELLDVTIRKTQSNGTTMESSDLLRNKSDIMRTVTMFKTDTIQQFNILYENVARLRKYQADFKAGKNGVTAADVKEVKGKLVNAVTAVALGAVVGSSILRLLANFLLQNMDKYRDKDDELTISSVSTAAGREMLGSIAGMVVFGDFIYEALEARIFDDRYYGISDMGLETVSDLLEDLSTSDLKKPESWKRISLDFTNALGIPVKNAINMADAVIAHSKDIQNGEFLSMNASADTSASQYYNRLYKALKKGEEERAERLKRELTGLGKTDAEILAGMRSAIKKSNKEYDSIYENMLADVEATTLFERLTEKEQKRVKSGISGYVADALLAEITGSAMTKENAKAAEYAKKGVDEVDYFLAKVVKNAFFADTNKDNNVSKQEYGNALDKGQYDGKVRSMLYGLK